MSNYREILRLQRLGLNKTEIAASHGCAIDTEFRWQLCTGHSIPAKADSE